MLNSVFKLGPEVKPVNVSENTFYNNYEQIYQLRSGEREHNQ